MASEIPISELPAGVPPTGPEMLPAVQAGETVRLTVTEILALITLAGLGGITSTQALAIVDSTVNQAYVGGVLYPQTAGEVAAAVVPTNYAYPVGNVLRYGADPTGAASSAVAIQAAMQVGAGQAVLPQGTYKLDNNISLDISKCSLVGQNATVNCVAGAVHISVTSTQGAEQCTKSFIRGIEFVGNNNAGQICLDFNAAADLVAGFSIENCSFTQLQCAEQVRNNAFEINHRGCTYSQQTGAVGCIYIPSGLTNYGERLSWNQCAFFNNALAINNQSNSCNIFASESSFDYCNQVIIVASGSALFSHCYFENDLDTNYWFQTTADGNIAFDFCYMSQTNTSANPKVNYNWASSAATNIGFITFRNCTLYAATGGGLVPAAPFLVATAGSAYGFGYGSKNRMIGFNPTSLGWAGVSTAASQAPSINSGLPGWTFGSDGTGGNPSDGGGAGPGGSNAILMQVAVEEQDQYIYYPQACVPGDNVGLFCQVKASNAAMALEMFLEAYDSSGALIGTVSSNLTLTTAFAPQALLYANLPYSTTVCRVGWKIPASGSNTGYTATIGAITAQPY